MGNHTKFSYRALEELKSEVKSMNLNIPIMNEIDILAEETIIGKKIVPNKIAVHPMEGCDGTEDGKPSDLTFRRYKRFARGGAGLLWFEATAVNDKGKANPRQLYICNENYDELKKLLDFTLKEAKDEYGCNYNPYTVLQLTHSGRYSRPGLNPQPIIAANNPYLDKVSQDKNYIITDQELEKLEDDFVNAAKIARDIGFDAVDIKSCHRYLNSELLSAFTREGRYGGSFENRTRFLLNIIEKIKLELGDSIDITLRLNVYDGIPYPYGWGVDKENPYKYDLEEPIKLIKILNNKGVNLINISAGNPYYNPHIGRPYDSGFYIPNEHSLECIERFLDMTKTIKEEVKDIEIIGTGLSWLREYGANVASGAIVDNYFDIAGFGRQAFAYPDFAADIIEHKKMFRNKCCIACSKCTEIMRDGGMTGCVIKDNEVYGEFYKNGRKGKPSLIENRVKEHI